VLAERSRSECDRFGKGRVLARLGWAGEIGSRAFVKEEGRQRAVTRETVYIAFGSNQGDRLDYCDRVVTLLGLLPHSQLVAVSSLYETEPMIDERTNPGTESFLNGVVCIETDIAPRDLLEICREIEQALGRDHDQRDGPRTLDLDILFYGARIIHETNLHIPHPRLHLRRFVLAPMVEVDPEWRHPDLGVTVKELLDGLPPTPYVWRLVPQPSARYGTRSTCSARPPSA
jgi:2-amino-4-hydroxy-6-hydroxymethyldihydropteridine diphosphokinase